MLGPAPDAYETIVCLEKTKSTLKKLKSERERQTPCDVTYKWNIKYGTNEPIDRTETDSHTRRTDLRSPRGQGGSGMDGEFGVSRCELFHLEG